MQWEEHLRNHEYDCIGAVVVDAVGDIKAVSDGILELSGYGRDVLLTMNATELLHPDDVARGLEVFSEVQITPGTRADGMYRFRLSNGDYGSYALRAINLGAEAENAIVFRISKLNDRTRVIAEAFSEDVVDATRMLCHEISLTEWFDWATRVGERHIAGLQLIVTIFNGDGDTEIHSRQPVPDDIRAANSTAKIGALPAHVQAALDEHNRGPWLAPNRVATRDGQRPERLTSVLIDTAGQITGFIEALRPTTSTPPEPEWLLHAMITRVLTAAMQRFELDRQLRWAADHDPLTGLVNRRRLVEAIERYEGPSAYLYMVDLDRFSWINNTLGHQVGDDALIAVGTGLTTASPRDAVIARMGGDEFVVWIPGPSADKDLLAQGERLRAALRFDVGGVERRSTIRSSIGAVEMMAGETPAQAISRADTAMYEAKRGGGDSLVAAPPHRDH